jgi:hypothetical protein
MGDMDEPLTGFLWGHDAVNNPNGLFFWNDAFLHSNEDTREKLAIFVMDTQVSQNESLAEINNSKIFTFATLLSSVQIFNIFDNLEEHNLIYLKSGIESAIQMYENTLNKKSDGYIFQKLLFLIRDWVSLRIVATNVNQS